MRGADVHAGRVAALSLIEPHADRLHVIKLGAAKAYGPNDSVNELRSVNARPPARTQDENGRRSAINCRMTRHASSDLTAEAYNSRPSCRQANVLRVY